MANTKTKKILKKIIIGNWKMNPLTAKDAEKLFSKISKSLSTIKKTDIVICAPTLYLNQLKKISKKVSLGAQNTFYGDVGAFTGEISADMLHLAGVRYVILGHSERRSMGESNELINKKIKGALDAGLIPILCVGETERDESHEYFNIVKSQVSECLSGVPKNLLSSIIVAYEPVWALSTTKDRRDATPEDSREMVVFIKKALADKFGADAEEMRIIYGGSVNEKDALLFLQEGGVDGLLPGRASLDPKKFTGIVNITENAIN